MFPRRVALIAVLLWSTANPASAQVFQLGIEESTINQPDQSKQSQPNISNDPAPATIDVGSHFFRRKHALKTAESTIDKMTRRDARAHHDNAVNLAELGKIEEAIAEDRLAVAADPSHPGYQVLLARLLTDGGQMEEALTVYENVCANFPEVRDDLSACVLQMKALLSIMRMEDRIDSVQASTGIANGGSTPESISATSVVPQPAAQPAAQAVARPWSSNRPLTPRELADDRPIDDLLY